VAPDIWTSSAVTALFVVFLTVLQVALWWRVQAYPGLGRWTAAMVLFSLSMLGVAANPPTVVWVFLIAPSLVVSLILALEGCREFRGVRPQIVVVYLVGAAAAVSAGYFEYIRNLNARIVVMSSFFALIALLCCVTLLTNVPAGERVGSRFTGGIFAAFALISIARVIYYRFAPPLTNFFEISWMGGASYSAQALFMAASMFGWLVMADERRLAELKRQRAMADSLAKRATEADSAKSELLAMIGHEVRNPLTGVLANCELLLGTELTPEQRSYAAAVDTSVDALLKVTDDLLDLSQIELGKLRIESSSFDLRSQIEGIAKLEEPLAVAKGLRLALDFSDSIPPRLIGDAGRIRQVILNLVANAVKFTFHGEVRIAATYQARDATCGELQFAVTDTGIGIAPEHIESLFERRGPAHVSTARVYGGRGIGLTISKKLTEIMDGRLEVESKVGQGSTFRVTLQLSVPSQASSAGQR